MAFCCFQTIPSFLGNLLQVHRKSEVHYQKWWKILFYFIELLFPVLSFPALTFWGQVLLFTPTIVWSAVSPTTRMFIRIERTVMKLQIFPVWICLSLLKIDPLAALAGVEANLSTGHKVLVVGQKYELGKQMYKHVWCFLFKKLEYSVRHAL